MWNGGALRAVCIGLLRKLATSPSKLRFAASPKFSEINPYGFVKLPSAVKCLRTREDLFFVS